MRRRQWLSQKDDVICCEGAVYCVTEAVLLWHLLASPASVLGNAWGVLTYRQRGQDKKLIAELQVKQTLKNQ